MIRNYPLHIAPVFKHVKEQDAREFIKQNLAALVGGQIEYLRTNHIENHAP